ncbi:MAG: IS66 family insertion sequence element accessory protein TnpB [Deltaproteobacteria bacterium]|nr:IS66 family insertion sequence element accessory protein TnpB [Deltaproteobacteria bacterium]MBK6686400.1 IS66 family insertion sequence element accessory protein TnpB [Deltaproteobacteria bacterium]MBK6688351.1 IS66 family insertion sequence element accessory protein TnpB [Deltaproteobacteria bacterium]MBK6688359.1 IS66 family insertion sequence element accessory protein TnpB [Deltaproteobacteria bacterium]MBK6688363.1 IS66 family insertion sequence element accessory protein TnpB [Deltaprot
MIGAERRVRVFARAAPTDMRKSFDTLSALVSIELGRDPLEGDMFLFVGARLRSAKVLFWDGTGLCVFHKRLSQGRFAAPWKRSAEGAITMSRSELDLFIEGSQLVFIGALSPGEIVPKRVATRALVVR